jgi:Flp pilus assembly secretin CpaC
MRAVRWLQGLAAAFVLGLAAVSPAAAEEIRVAMDQAVPMRLSAPAEGVAIGNPSIASVTVQDDQLLFITGRSYGSTNLVVVGADARLLFAGRVTVTADETNAVMVTRGMETSRMQCTPICRPTTDINGSPSLVDLLAQITGRSDAAGGAR